MLEERPVPAGSSLLSQQVKPGLSWLQFGTREFELSGGDETMSERWSAQQEALSVLPRYCP